MTLTQAAKFWDLLRRGLLGPTISPQELEGVQALLDACKGWPLAWMAYGLATAYHETAHTMQPVMEAGGEAYLTRMYDPSGLRPEVAARLGNTEVGDGPRFCGRGFCQLTGRANYLKAGLALGLAGLLLEQPDKALQLPAASQILERGMREGWFTGRRLVEFLPVTGFATRAQFMAARRIVNGTDDADLIADYANRFQDALLAGEWA